MRILDRVKALEALSGVTGGDYDVEYTYDDAGKITGETVVGSIERETVFEYDENDNIKYETITEGRNVQTKEYIYDSSDNITKILVTTANV